MRGVQDELGMLRARRMCEVEVRVGERFDVGRLVREEVLRGGDGGMGDVGVVVCGPPEMADEVRCAVGRVAGQARRGVVFIDEAFGW